MISRWFDLLSSSRPQSLGDLPCPITFAEMRAFYEFMGVAAFITPEEFSDYMLFLDSVLIEFYKEHKPPPPKPPPSK